MLALVLVAAYAAIAFGLRSYLQFRRTGSAGVHGLGGRFGSLEWFASVGLVAAFAGLGATPIAGELELAGMQPLFVSPPVTTIGLVVFMAGFIATFSAQTAMGTSWRVGVQPGEVTELVTSGPFAVVRNPIFSAILITAAGLVLMVPSALAIASYAITIAALELQVRFVEEPHLVRVHGRRYRRYTSRVGRFFPGLGLCLSSSGQPSPLGQSSQIDT